LPRWPLPAEFSLPWLQQWLAMVADWRGMGCVGSQSEQYQNPTFAVMTPQSPTDAHHEGQRLRALHDLNALDAPGDATLDQLVELAAWAFNVPMVCLALADAGRVWFAASCGVVESELPRWPDLGLGVALSRGFCEVADAQQDPATSEHPWVLGEQKVRWVAHAALTTPEGFHVGAFMLMDTMPRVLSDHEIRMLTAMARLAMDHLVLKSSVRQSWLQRQALEQAQGWLIESAALDELTQVANRRALMAFLDKTQALARRERQPLAVLLFDVLAFRKVNELHGDGVGDHVLIEVATRLATSARGSELVGRMAGDEFMAILYTCTPDQARLAADRYTAAVQAKPVGLGAGAGEALPLRMAVGLCAMDSETPVSPDEIYRQAACALDQSKLAHRHG
jgi:diguanylate cyclase (GGDEF)-like protein